MARKPADKVGMVVRFSEALRRRIEKAAQANNQSMNSEIVRRLEESFRREDTRAERLEERRGFFARVDRHFEDWVAKQEDWVAKQKAMTPEQKAEVNRVVDELLRPRSEQEDPSNQGRDK